MIKSFSKRSSWKTEFPLQNQVRVQDKDLFGLIQPELYLDLD